MEDEESRFKHEKLITEIFMMLIVSITVIKGLNITYPLEQTQVSDCLQQAFRKQSHLEERL